MTQEISGVGVVVTIIASNTLPVGATITEFADDSDPLEFASVKIADTAMGLNGDLLKWAKAVPLPMVLNIIPGSLDDQTLQVLADANRVGKNKSSAGDEIKATVAYPDGSFVTLTGGVLTDAMFGRSISSAGRQKTKTYAFAFQNKIGA